MFFPRYSTFSTDSSVMNGGGFASQPVYKAYLSAVLTWYGEVGLIPCRQPACVYFSTKNSVVAR